MFLCNKHKFSHIIIKVILQFYIVDTFYILMSFEFMENNIALTTSLSFSAVVLMIMMNMNER